MSDLNKLKYILNPNPDLSSDICTFIKQSLELRQKVHVGQTLFLLLNKCCIVLLLFVLLYCLTLMGVKCN
jgi:hypothetical protein